MPDTWIRAVSTGPTQPGTGYFGTVPMAQVNPNETVLRSWVFFSAFTLRSGGEYPPGGSLLRVGLGWKPLNSPSGMYPIENPAADWLWITSLAPEQIQLSRAVDVSWFVQWSTRRDQSVKAMRRNRTEDVYALWLGWEFQLAGNATGFEIPYWNASLDMLIRDNDGQALDAPRVLAGELRDPAGVQRVQLGADIPPR